MPQPAPVVGNARAVERSTVLTCAGRQRRVDRQHQATVPVTRGAEKLVPTA